MKARSRKIGVLMICILFAVTVPGCFVPEATAGFESVEAVQGGGREISGDVAEQVKAPDTYFAEWSQNSFHSSANAKVEIPDVPSIPYIRVAASNFTQGQVDRATEYLFGSKKLYDLNKPMAAEEIEEELSYLYEALESSDDGQDQASIGQRINELEEQLKTASSETAYPESDGKLKTEEASISETQTVKQELLDVFAEDGNWRYEMRVNNNAQVEGAADPYDVSGMSGIYTGANFRYERIFPASEGMWIYMAGEDPFEMTRRQIEREGKDYVGITLDEALDEAQGFFSAMGVEMELSDLDIVAMAYDWDKGGVEPPAAIMKKIEEPDIQYRFRFVRKAEGVSTLPLTGASAMAMSANMPAGNYFQAEWTYEVMNMAVSKDGITSIDWISPLNMGEVIPQMQELLPFDQITEIYEGMLYLAYVDRYGNMVNDAAVKSVELLTDRVQLGYFRVSDEASVESGTYIPAWGFYGRERTVYADGEGSEYSWEVPDPLLLINALDGSILDPARGAMSTLSPAPTNGVEQAIPSAEEPELPAPAAEEQTSEIQWENGTAVDG